MEKKTIYLFLLLIIALAAFFRFYQLDLIPQGVYPDEAMNANQAIFEPGKVFYPENNGREGLFINLIYISFSFFGISLWSLKLVSALIGVLSVIAIYFLAKEIFIYSSFSQTEREAIALASSFFLSLSFWHVNFSRIAFRGILLPLFLTLIVYFLIRGFRREKISDFVISGLFLGLGFYSYTSFRLAVLLIALILFLYFLRYLRDKKGKQFLLFSSSFILVAFIIALPIGFYFLENPEYFVSRLSGISVFSQDNPLLSFLKSSLAHGAMFNIWGDNNWRHNFAGSPQLFWPIGIFFLIGFIFNLKKIIRFLRKKDYSSLIPYATLLTWLIILLLPGTLTYEGVPHALRTIGVIPAVYLLSGLGALLSYNFIRQKIKGRGLKICLIVFFLFFLTYSQFTKYFINWANREETAQSFTLNYTAIGWYLNSLPEEVNKYVIVNELNSPLYGISIPAQTPIFIESTVYGQPRAKYLKDNELDKIKKGEEAVIIPLYKESLTEKIKTTFPSAEKESLELFDVYRIKISN
jgi:4-amino-4-deoxy-L-arabinose transferase-like glycosyltransferase